MEIRASSGRTPSRGAIAASIALLIVVWAVNFIAGKIGLRSIPVLTLASFRVVLAGAVMIPIYLVCSRLPAFAEAGNARHRGFNVRDLWTFLYLGFFGVTVNQMCFTMGLRYTSVSHASVVVGLGPIYTLVLAVLFGLERATLRKATGMGIALVGIAVMASEKGLSAHSPSLLGDAITMTGSIGFAMYVVLGKRVAGKYDTLTMTAFNHFAGALDRVAAGDPPGEGARLRRELANDSVERMGSLVVHGAVQFRDGVRFLFLAAAVSGSFAVGRLLLSITTAGNGSRDSLAGRKRAPGDRSRGQSSPLGAFIGLKLAGRLP